MVVFRLSSALLCAGRTKFFFPLTRISKFIVIARELDTNEAFSPRSSRVDCARASHTRLTRQHIM